MFSGKGIREGSLVRDVCFRSGLHAVTGHLPWVVPGATIQGTSRKR